MYHVWGREEVHTGFWWGNLKERGHVENLDVDGDNIKIDLQEVGWEGMDWIPLAPCGRGNEPSSSTK
jgi:hypothetical protein